jgi:putative hydrolase of the HAD superfamily
VQTREQVLGEGCRRLAAEFQTGTMKIVASSEHFVSAVLVFDADNTLWNTNAVFRKAQLEILRVFAKSGLIKEPESELDNLRLIDKALANLAQDFEYRPIMLPVALDHYYSRNVSVDEAAAWALQQGSGYAQDFVRYSCESFNKALEQIPPMFKDAEEVLIRLQDSRSSGTPITLVMFSEGKAHRLERILEAHDLRNRKVFDQIVIQKKSLDSFCHVREMAYRHSSSVKEYPETLFVMVGDSIQRDIVLANRTGFVTVYKPAGFLGEEDGCLEDEEPRFRIDSLLEIPGLLGGLGIHL